MSSPKEREGPHVRMCSHQVDVGVHVQTRMVAITNNEKKRFFNSFLFPTSDKTLPLLREYIYFPLFNKLLKKKTV